MWPAVQSFTLYIIRALLRNRWIRVVVAICCAMAMFWVSLMQAEMLSRRQSVIRPFHFIKVPPRGNESGVKLLDRFAFPPMRSLLSEAEWRELTGGEEGWHPSQLPAIRRGVDRLRSGLARSATPNQTEASRTRVDSIGVLLLPPKTRSGNRFDGNRWDLDRTGITRLYGGGGGRELSICEGGRFNVTIFIPVWTRRSCTVVAFNKMHSVVPGRQGPITEVGLEPFDCLRRVVIVFSGRESSPAILAQRALRLSAAMVRTMDYIVTLQVDAVLMRDRFLHRLLHPLRSLSPRGKLVAASQCTTVNETLSGHSFTDAKMVEKGVRVQRAEATTLALARQKNGLPVGRKLLNAEVVTDAVGLMCVAYDRRLFALAGGFHFQTKSSDDDVDSSIGSASGLTTTKDVAKFYEAVLLSDMVQRLLSNMTEAEIQANGKVTRRAGEHRAAVREYNDTVGDLSTRRTWAESLRMSKAVVSVFEGQTKDLRTVAALTLLVGALRQVVMQLRYIVDDRLASRSPERYAWGLSLRLHTLGADLMVSSAVVNTIYRHRGVDAKGRPRTWIATFPPSYLLDDPKVSQQWRLYRRAQIGGRRWSAPGPTSVAGMTAVVGALNPENVTEPSPSNATARHDESSVRVVWDAICCRCCGFSNEITHLALPLIQYRIVYLTNEEACFCSGLTPTDADTIARLQLYPARTLPYVHNSFTIHIMHMAPHDYHAFATFTTPMNYVIGRSMTELSAIPQSWLAAMHYVNELWVPCEFVRDVFVRAGIPASKLTIIPEAIDTDAFDPSLYESVSFPLTSETLGAETVFWCNKNVTAASAGTRFKFFSSFKWEPRKGWDVLLEAYQMAFAPNDTSVSLYILTHQFIFDEGGPVLGGQAELWFVRAIRRHFGNVSLEDAFPHVCIIANQVAESLVPRLYRSMDAFVLPTRGEGWGLPAMQAMSMALPTISTAYSGNLAFMHPGVSYLIPVDGFDNVTDGTYILPQDKGKFTGVPHWARPSVNGTAKLLRNVHRHPAEARRIGQMARQHIVDNFHEDVVAKLIDRRISAIYSSESGRKSSVH